MPLCQKLLSHHFAGPKQTILDRSQRQAGDFDNFLVGQILRMAQDNQLTISGRQRTHHRFNFYAALFPFALLFRTEALALERQIVVIVFRSR